MARLFKTIKHPEFKKKKKCHYDGSSLFDGLVDFPAYIVLFRVELVFRISWCPSSQMDLATKKKKKKIVIKMPVYEKKTLHLELDVLILVISCLVIQIS